MVHVGNDRHVADVGLLVHDGPDLVYCEVHLCKGGWGRTQTNWIPGTRLQWNIRSIVRPDPWPVLHWSVL
jgi:hypothetical protein